MTVGIPASILVLLPSVLQMLERVLNKIGFIGKDAIRTQLLLDKRHVVRSTFVTAANGSALLDAIGTYFEYNRRANELLALHVSFILSLIFGAMENSGEALKIEGWYVGGIVLVVLSFVIFVFRLVRSAPSATRPFPGWSIWAWAMFVIIISAEGIERILKSP